MLYILKLAEELGKFIHFCSKTRMKIEGLSGSPLEKLIQHDWIRNFGDLGMRFLVRVWVVALGRGP